MIKINMTSDQESSDSFSAAAVFIMFTISAAYLSLRKNKKRRRHGGSVIGKARNREIGRFSGGKQLHRDYFLAANELNEVTNGFGSTFNE
ncbi:MAG: hypothetical protein AAF551_14800 [Bacteroidota bacterium]